MLRFFQLAESKHERETTMTATTAKLESLKKTINLMSRIMDDMSGNDYEAEDNMRRAIRDAKADVLELELELAPATDEDDELVAA
jgi:hypothetical protein